MSSFIPLITVFLFFMIAPSADAVAPLAESPKTQKALMRHNIDEQSSVATVGTSPELAMLLDRRVLSEAAHGHSRHRAAHAHVSVPPADAVKDSEPQLVNNKKLISAQQPAIAEVPVSSKAIVIMGMDRQFQTDSIEAAATLCNFFDEGRCALSLMVPDPGQQVVDQLKTKIPYIHMLQQPSLSGVSRTDKLATLRNALLEGSLKQFPNFDYLLMTDLDHTIRWTAQTRSVILNAMTPLNDGKWDGISFLGSEYYDWWGARCTSDAWNCWGHVDENGKSSCFDMSHYSCVTDLSKERGPNKFVPISSAYNGLTIYKRQAIGSCRYNGLNTDPASTRTDDCELVQFHRCLNVAGKKFMLNSGKLDVHWDTSDQFLELHASQTGEQ